MITANDVKGLMATTGLRQGELAARVGVSQPTVSRWLKGQTPDPAQEAALRALMAEAGEGPLARQTSLTVAPPVRRQSQEYAEAPNAPEIDKSSYPRNVPVRGIAVGGEDADFTINGETGDLVRRPPGLEGKRGVYALHIVGESMWPAYKHGSLVYVDANRVPGVGEDAVIEIYPDEPNTGDPGRGFLKRVKRVGPSKITVEQFNPPRDIDFERCELKSFHRVVPLEELLGY